MDVSTLAVQVKSDGIKETTDALLALALAADKANNSSDNLSKKSDEVATSTDDAAKKTSGYTARLEERALALGKNVEQTATAIAQYRALSEVDQSRAEAAGREIDSWKARGDAQGEATTMNKQLQASYQKLTEQADAYYATLAKNQAKGDALNEVGKRAEDYKKLASAQAEAIRMNDAMTASEDRLAAMMRSAKVEDKARALKTLAAAQSEAIAMDKSMTIAQDATKASNDKWLASLQSVTNAYGLSGKALQNYRADLVAAEAASRGMSTQAAEHVQKMRDVDKATSGAHGSTSGIVRELIVLGHEMSQGNFSRFGGSLIVMGERINIVGYAMKTFGTISTATGLSVGGVIAVMGLAAVGVLALVGALYEIGKGAAELNKFNHAMILTGGSIGQTRDSMDGLVQSLKGEAHGAIGRTSDMLEALAVTGKFGAQSLQSVARAAIDFQNLTGESTEKVAQMFSNLSQTHGKIFNEMQNHTAEAVAKMNDQYHYLSAQQYEHIRLLAAEGQQQQALMENSDLLHESFTRQNEKVGILVASYRGWVSILQETVHWLKEVGKDWFGGSKLSSQIEDATKKYENLVKLAIQAKNGGATEAGGQKLQADPAAYENYKSAIAQQLEKIKSLNAAAQKEITDVQQQESDARFSTLGVEGQREWDAERKKNRTKAEIRSEEAERIRYSAANINTDNVMSWERHYKGTADAMGKEMDLAIKNGQLKILTEEQINQQIENSNNKHKDAVKKERSPGTTGVKADVAAIESEFNMKKADAENQIKLAEYLHKSLMLDDQSYVEFKNAVLNQMAFDLISSEQQEIDKMRAFHGKTAAEINDNAKAIVLLEAKKYKNISDLQTKAMENGLSLQAKANKALDAQSKADETSVNNLQKKTFELQAQNAAYLTIPESVRQAGFTEKQMQDYVTQAKIDSSLAEMAAISELGDLQTATDKQRLEDLGKLIVAERALKVEQTLRESQIASNAAHLAQTAADKTTTAAYQMEASFKKAFKSMEDALVNFVMSGKLDFKGLIDSFIKDILRVNIASMFETTGITSGLKNLFGLGGTASSVGAAGSAASGSSFMGNVGSALSGISSLSSLASTGASFGAGFSAAGAAGAATGDAAMLASAVASGNVAVGASVGASVGSALAPLTTVLAAIPVWGWVALAGIAAIGIFSGKGETRYGGAYSYDQANGVRKNEGPSGGDIALPQVQSAIKGTADGISKLLSDFGSSATLSGYTAGLESSKNGKGFVFAGGNVGGTSFGQNRDGRQMKGSMTQDEALVAFQLSLEQSTIQALKAANLGGYVGKYLNSLGELTKLDKQQADAVMAQISLVQQFTVALKSMPFTNLKNASFAATGAIAELTGGFGALSTKLTSYYNNFYSATEKSSTLLAQVGAALSAVNLPLPTTRDGFKSLVDSLDLSTEAGQKAYATLINNADAFANAVPAATAATTATNNVTSATSALTSAYQTQKSALDSTISSMKTFAQGVRTFKDGLLLGNLSTLTPEQKYAASKSAFNTTLGAANKGDTIAQGQLQNAATAFLTASQAVNASSDIYTKDFDFIQKSLGDTAVYADSQVQIAQDSLVALDAQVAGLITVNASVLTVTQAINNLRLAGGGTPTASTGMLQVNGSHANGLNSVPFNGYIAQLHKGEQVLTAPEASNYKAGGNMQPLVNEIKSLHDEIRNLRNDQAAQTRDLMVSNMAANDAAAKQIVQGSVKAAETQNWKTSTMKKAAII